MSIKLLSKIKNNPSLLFLYSIVLIPILTMCYFLFADYSSREKEEVLKNEQVARVLAQNLDSYLENVKSTLAGVSTLPPVQNHDRAKIETIFENLLIADNHVSLYWATDANGRILAKYPNRWPDKRDDGFIKEVMKSSTFVSEPRRGTMSGLEIITVSSVIKDHNGKVIGVIGASIPLENLRQKLLLKIGETGFPILVTKKGTFLVHPQREQISKKINLSDPIFQAIIKGGSGTLDYVAPFDQRRKFFSYVPLKQADWIVLVIQPLSEFHAQTMEFFTRNVVIIILVAFLVILAAYYLMLFRKREEDARILQAEKLSIVGQLAAGMAHEIRNPLTSIRGFAQLAASGKNTLAPDYFRIIMSEVDRIEGIIKESMLLAKPTPVQFKLVNPEQLFNEIYAIMHPQANLNGVELLLIIDNNLPNITGEPNHLKQVFINLIKNSIESIPAAAAGQILIDVQKAAGKIIVSIRDNGCGIPPEILEDLGKPFVSTKENGTGLGLMVSYRIIQNHGGTIKVQSNQRQGTTFTIELLTGGASDR